MSERGITMKIIKNQRFDEERALYGISDTEVTGCRFDGPQDGESAFKECSGIVARDCYMNLRYPFWHVHGLTIADTEMTDQCRAALWYSDDIHIMDTKMHGIKALRECQNVLVENCSIISPEFGWSTIGIQMRNTTATSEYFMMRAEHLTFSEVHFTGKYSFQYIKNAVFTNCEFDTKDAFWHGENILVKDSVVKGEYLAWYSKNLTLENCQIIGTQPFCYCENLRLINCTMVDTDLCFEKSSVEASVKGHVLSVKNPLSGEIHVESLGELIRDDAKSQAKVFAGNQLLV